MIEIGPPRHDRDWDGYAAVSALAFGATLADATEWLSFSRHTSVVRLARRGERVVGGCLAYRVGQFFGGHAVTGGPVGDVCVLPEERGRGLARLLLADLDDAMRAEGIAVSSLWPSTVRLYRGCGWEVVGPETGWSVPTHVLSRLRGEGRLVESPGRGVRTLQRRVAATYNGPLDRPDWWWEWRRPRHRDERKHSYAWVEDGLVTGFMVIRQDDASGPGTAFRLAVTELWWETADALHGLLGSLGSHSTMAPEVRFQDSVLPPVPEITWAIDAEHHRFGVTTREPWMLRLVDAGSAMAQRGWPGDARGAVHLEIQDPLHRSTRRLVLEVEGGAATTRPGGEGRVALGIGALAAWYGGGLTATRLARLGMARGDAGDLAVMDRLTADLLPAWLPDHF